MIICDTLSMSRVFTLSLQPRFTEAPSILKLVTLAWNFSSVMPTFWHIRLRAEYTASASSSSNSSNPINNSSGKPVSKSTTRHCPASCDSIPLSVVPSPFPPTNRLCSIFFFTSSMVISSKLFSNS